MLALPAKSADTANFFHRAPIDDDYWTRYLAARPEYSSTFYDSIFEYHSRRGAPFEHAHDVATGPGQVAAVLAERFAHVTASDNNSSHLAVARARLAPLVATRQVELVECAAEDLADSGEHGPVDFVAAAECMPLVDAQASVRAFAGLLRLGGTLAMWFYGRAAFAEEEFRAACQPILDAIMDAMFARVIKGGGPQHRVGWKRATDCKASWLDSIELEEGVWTDVERHKWNTSFSMPHYSSAACDFEIDVTSAIGSHEMVTEQSDPTLWERKWRLEDVKRFVLADLPTFSADMQNEAAVRELYVELGKAMGGEEALRKISWPAVLILARKK